MEEPPSANVLAAIGPQSRLLWLIQAVGGDMVFLLPVAILAFTFVLIMVVRGKGPPMVGAILLVVPLPMYVAVWRAIGLAITSFQVIAITNTPVTATSMAEGLAQMLAGLWFAAGLTIPIFLLAAAGLFVRALVGEFRGIADRRRQDPATDMDDAVAARAS